MGKSSVLFLPVGKNEGNFFPLELYCKDMWGYIRQQVNIVSLKLEEKTWKDLNIFHKGQNMMARQLCQSSLETAACVRCFGLQL